MTRYDLPVSRHRVTRVIGSQDFKSDMPDKNIFAVQIVLTLIRFFDLFIPNVKYVLLSDKTYLMKNSNMVSCFKKGLQV